MQRLSSFSSRRAFLAGAGALVAAIGGSYIVADAWAQAEAAKLMRTDGKPRVPPGQRVLQRLKPMGGEEGDPAKSAFSVRVYGEVDAPFTCNFAQLTAMPASELAVDVHCVTGWTVLDANVVGVLVRELAMRAKVRDRARYVVLEGAHGYTANVPLALAMAPTSIIVHSLNGLPLARPHGAPVRAIIPDLYFWKSAKWLTGIRFVRRDEPGYWEQRGYHNLGDPWLEQRYS